MSEVHRSICVSKLRLVSYTLSDIGSRRRLAEVVRVGGLRRWLYQMNVEPAAPAMLTVTVWYPSVTTNLPVSVIIV